MAKNRKQYVVSMAVALDLIEKAAEYFPRDHEKSLQFINTVIAAINCRKCITSDFFSYFGSVGQWMFEQLKEAMDRSDRARQAAARRKARRLEEEKDAQEATCKKADGCGGVSTDPEVQSARCEMPTGGASRPGAVKPGGGHFFINRPLAELKKKC